MGFLTGAFFFAVCLAFFMVFLAVVRLADFFVALALGFAVRAFFLVAGAFFFPVARAGDFFFAAVFFVSALFR